jgi:aryl carrier-like protein
LAEIPLDLAARPRAPQQAARNEGEELLLRAVRAVLAREDVGIHDSFFAVGGDSIKAILLTAELKRQGWELDLKSVFQSSDFATAAALLRPSPGPQQPAGDLAESGASAVSEEDLSLIREHVALLKSEPARRAT